MAHLGLMSEEAVPPADQCRTTVARDGCVVASESLAEILLPFLDGWSRERPAVGGRFEAGSAQRTTVTYVTGAEWLARETGVPEKTIRGLASRDAETGRPKPRNPTTELRIADALVAAVGRPEVFHDGTLEVLKNPNSLASVAKTAW